MDGVGGCGGWREWGLWRRREEGGGRREEGGGRREEGGGRREEGGGRREEGGGRREEEGGVELKKLMSNQYPLPSFCIECFIMY